MKQIMWVSKVWTIGWICRSHLKCKFYSTNFSLLCRQKHIEKCLAQLPKLEEEHRKKEEARLLKEEESRKKKAVLLEAAREKLGYAIDPRSQRFKEMVEEMEKEEKKQKKALKRKGIGT